MGIFGEVMQISRRLEKILHSTELSLEQDEILKKGYKKE